MAEARPDTMTSHTEAHAARPKHRKRTSDPFDHIPLLKPVDSGEGAQDHGSDDEGRPESALQRAVVAPLLFVSFLVSLFIVERRDRAYRVAEHPGQAPRSFWARYSPFVWIDPEPYQEPEDSTWQQEDREDTRNPATDGKVHASKRRSKSWFRSKKHRNMAKMELDDAVKGWASVEAAIVGAGVVSVGGALWMVKSWVFG